MGMVGGWFRGVRRGVVGRRQARGVGGMCRDGRAMGGREAVTGAMGLWGRVRGMAVVVWVMGLRGGRCGLGWARGFRGVGMGVTRPGASRRANGWI
jgi:hypothetical protein